MYYFLFNHTLTQQKRTTTPALEKKHQNETKKNTKKVIPCGICLFQPAFLSVSQVASHHQIVGFDISM